MQWPSWKTSGHLRRAIFSRGKPMRHGYDVSKAKRGPVIPVPKGKTRITIRLDADVIAWFRSQVDQAGGRNYQTLISDALRHHIAREREPLEETVRRVVREEIRRALRALSSGRRYQTLWEKARGDKIEGINLADSKAIKTAVSIPVISTGGFQTASVIEQAISGGSCDAVSIARSLVANNDLVKIFERGLDRPEKPCTYCNKCLVNVLQNPLGCYEESRYESRQQMIDQIMSVFDPPPFA